MRTKIPFSSLIGKLVHEIKQTDEKLIFITDTGIYHLYHDQDCCESVFLEDICGDLQDLIGHRICKAEEATSTAAKARNRDNGAMWTFYLLSSDKGGVTLRWHGESNGYYSVAVNLWEIKENENPPKLM